MTKLTGAALDRAVAHAMGLKSVNNCDQWGASMTQEIIELARDSGMELYGLGKDRARFVHHLEAFAKLVAEAEREACAKVCEHQPHWVFCADAIRARGQA